MSKRVNWRILAPLAALTTASIGMTGCNDAQAGLLLGSGLGALTGQAIGGDTEGTLLGLGIGAAAGYIIGNESDKARHQYYGHYDWAPAEYSHHHSHCRDVNNYDY